MKVWMHKKVVHKKGAAWRCTRKYGDAREIVEMHKNISRGEKEEDDKDEGQREGRR